MSLLAGKQPGYFGRAVDEGKLQRFLRYGLPLSPEAPAAFTDWSAAAAEGGVIIVIGAMPDARDAVYYGDGAGVLLDTIVTLAGTEFPIGATEPGTFFIAYEFEGDLGVTIHALGSAGAGDPSSVTISSTGGPVMPGDPEFSVWPDDPTIWPSDNTVFPSS